MNKQAQAWQDISTAPKDGTRILLARKQVMSGELIVVSGYWNSGSSYNLPHWSTAIGMYDPTLWATIPPLPPAPPLEKEENSGG